MQERKAARVQAERGIFDRERLRFADGAIGEIRSVANDGEAEMPEMHSDLIRATRARVCFIRFEKGRTALANRQTLLLDLLRFE